MTIFLFALCASLLLSLTPVFLLAYKKQITPSSVSKSLNLSLTIFYSLTLSALLTNLMVAQFSLALILASSLTCAIAMAAHKSLCVKVFSFGCHLSEATSASRQVVS